MTVHVMSKRGRRKMTIQERIDSLLGKNDGFVALRIIYKPLRASSISERAGIRGVLNRGCGRMYQRNKKSQGEYKLKVV